MTRTSRFPRLVQIFNGMKPADARPIQVDVPPGSKWRYSGGGYTVMQQMIVDVTGKPFPSFMQESVLGPLGMEESTFEQPLPADKAKRTATAHLRDRSLVKGKWHIYPEMATAGLWTTPSDLSRFAIGVQEALAGRSDKTLSKKMTRQMLTEEKDNDGLGVFLEGSKSTLRFGHGGRDEGFDARLTAYAETGQGDAIMINTNDNSAMVSRILQAIARAYHWPDYPSSAPAKHPAAESRQGRTRNLPGRYEIANNQMVTLAAERGHLMTLVNDFPDEEFLPEADDRFHSSQRDVQITFLKDGMTGGQRIPQEGKQPRKEERTSGPCSIP